MADEASGVVRDRGLVFLHGGRVLEFDRTAAVALSKLLEVPARGGRGWCSLEEPEGPAERLNQIMLELPDPDPDEIYREIKKEMNNRGKRAGRSQRDESQARAKTGAAEEGGEATESGSATGETAGADAGGEGNDAGAGTQRGLRGLAAQGMLRPLSEKISAMREKIQWEWVDHSALLKKLVREFREGDKRLALERAIPLGAAG